MIFFVQKVHFFIPRLGSAFFTINSQQFHRFPSFIFSRNFSSQGNNSRRRCTSQHPRCELTSSSLIRMMSNMHTGYTRVHHCCSPSTCGSALRQNNFLIALKQSSVRRNDSSSKSSHFEVIFTCEQKIE